MDPRIHPWTEAEIKLVMENYKKMPRKDVVKLIHDELGIERSFGSLKHFYYVHGLKNGIDGKFKKGNLPPYAGKKLPPEVYEKVKKNFFKKGELPPNTCEIGTKTYSGNPKTGTYYWYIKVAHPNKWEAYHRWLWEKEYGPIPEGKRLIFLDGNTKNCELSNLRLVSTGEVLRINSIAPKGCSAEERNVYADIVQMERKIKELQK